MVRERKYMASASHSSEMAYSPVQDTSRSKRMVCLGCSLVCDDIVARPNSDEFQTAGQLCSKGLHWLADSSAIRNHESTLLARESGIDEVLDYAAGKFAAAVRPLILLASDISNEVARAAIALADRAHAVLDIDGSASRVNFYSALQNGSVCTSTDTTAGRSLTMAVQVSPPSRDAYTWPPVVPK